MRELPTGTVTFLFTDIEGSTRLLEELGEGFRVLQDDHAAIVRAAIADGDGVEVRTEGDSFFAVFQTPGGAIRAAVRAQRALAGHGWPEGRSLRVRMGMHIGEGVLGGDDYLGLDVNRAARIAAVGWGGQVVISDAVRGMVEHDLPEGVAVRSLGMHRLRDLARPEHLFDLVIAGLPSEFPPVRSLEAPIDLPVPAHVVRRPRRGDRRGQEAACGEPPPHADRPGWHRKDETGRTRGRGQSRPSSPTESSSST